MSCCKARVKQIQCYIKSLTSVGNSDTLTSSGSDGVTVWSWLLQTGSQPLLASLALPVCDSHFSKQISLIVGTCGGSLVFTFETHFESVYVLLPC